jgi:hypothetical protein
MKNNKDYVTVIDQRFEVLKLLTWEIKSLHDRYSEAIISKYKLEKDSYTFINDKGTDFTIEIVETSPCKFSMLSDIDAYFCGLSSLKELKEILTVKYKIVCEDDILWINRIKLI